MNCLEYRELIEDALDASLHGEPKRHVRRHLEHCEACRAYFEACHAEHVALFRGINAACATLHLPEGFADRLAASARARQAARRGWRRFALPRWALVAALLVALMGFVFANVKWSMENEELDNGTTGTAGTSATTDAISGVQGVPDVSAVSDVPIASDVPVSQPSNQQGEKTMRKEKAATAALAVAMATVPLAAANGDEYQFIISGDPVAAADANSSYASSDTGPLTSGPLADGVVFTSSLEARYCTIGESPARKLRSDKFRSIIMSFR